MTIQIGRYRHCKGHEYEVIATARHSESLDELVIYRQLPDDGKVWARPMTKFLEYVSINGKDKPRFEYLGPTQDNSSIATSQ